ncbi:glycosyltransferase family 4 protein [Pedobacter immunditicola]|uniref:glycosyltransferase family 4 protein n=1 Tax=Pedobacter immunditicola TaxID=3133440 RepID=UPI0030B4CC88
MKKITVGFYLENKGIKNVDCSKIYEGNPGIGGTEFSMISLIYHLTLLNNDINVIVYAEFTSNLPAILNVRTIGDTSSLKKQLLLDKPDILILRYSQNGDSQESLLNIFQKLDLKIVIWAHCFLPYSVLQYLSKNSQVSRIICVGREQLDSFRDHPSFYKSLYIFNGLNTTVDYSKILPFAERPNEVTYVGSIIAGKGFDLLAKSWKKVLESVPDAKLNVIGTGKLYDRNIQMGKFNIAEENYEEKFIHYLLGGDKKLLPSVNFHGILGVEKIDILKRTKIGVPNPSGVSETFGYTGVEMQLAGCKIVTRKVHGYLDTVFSESGILIEKDKELSTSIIKLLQRNDYDPKKSINFIQENFDFVKVAEDWKNVLIDIKNNKPVLIESELHNKKFKFKWLREINRRLKHKFFIAKISPSLILYETIYIKIKIYVPLLLNIPLVIKKVNKLLK